MPETVTFQDSLFTPERVVQRTLESGTILQLRLEPLSGERVRVLSYRQKLVGGRWKRLKAEEGRTVSWAQLGLRGSFEDVFR